MPKFETSNYRTVDEYRFASETFARFSGLLLFGFARHPSSTRHLIAQNATARTVMMVRGIITLWDMSDYQDCWTLHRSLLDRYFHLAELGKSNSHTAFDDWSFMKQFEAQNRVQSDPRFQSVTKSTDFTPTPEQKSRYYSLAKSKPIWKRPRAEDVAKQMGLDFLYTYSYDFASSHVHPMANDGQEDFFTITKLEPRPDFPSHVSVLHNSLLVACLLVMEAMNQSELMWKAVVYHFFEHLIRHLEDGTEDYILTFTEIASQGPEFRLCEPKRPE